MHWQCRRSLVARFSNVCIRAQYCQEYIITHRIVYIRTYMYLHTYHSRFIPEGVAEASQIPRRPRFTKIIYL
jgi:hypothetical protein